MARLSRLLSAVSLGIAATAAAAAVAVATEYAPVHRAPTHRSESAGDARVVVKFKARSAILSAGATTGATSASVGGPQKASAMGSRLGLALTDGRILGERTQVMKSSGMTSSALASTLAADSDVEWVEVDRKSYVQVAVDDPLYPDNLPTSAAATGPVSGQWYLRAPGIDASGRNVASSINIEPAWAITHGSTAIVIGDIDTGITQHPDLDSKMLTGYDFITDVPTANDSSARDADPSDPGDYVTAAENSNSSGDFYKCNDDDYPDKPPGSAVPVNSSWHGTQTAGILGAATNNGAGMAGIAYGVPIIPARALGKCGGYVSDIMVAAEWAGGIAVSGVPANVHPARVINMSLGASDTCSLTYSEGLTALRDKGVIVVAAAGNDAGLPVSAPANCKPSAGSADQTTPVVIAVAGLRHSGSKVGFSDIGPEVTISAPGGNCINTASGTPCLYPILTTRNAGTTAPVASGGTYSDGLNNPSLGTSFATPMVAGTVALMLSANPSLTNASVVRILKATARPFPTVSDTVPNPPVCTAPSASVKQEECICTTSTCGAGMLDAGAAVAMAFAEAGGIVTAPVATITSSATTLQVGATLALAGTGSTTGSSGAAITTYAWSLPDNDALVSLSSTSASSITLTGLAAGSTHVMLTVTDAAGATSQSTTAITVTAAASSGNGATSSGGGGGGGAANPAWLLALAIAGLLVGPRRQRVRK
jgi:serine protease